MIASGTELPQAFSLVVVLFVLAIQIKRIKNKPECKYTILPVMFWMIDALLFYVILFLDRSLEQRLLPITYTAWSAILRLHGYLTMLGIEVFRYLAERRIKKDGC
jgi:hypothetical protein